MGYISFFIALFLLISRLVNRRMILNGYTPLQAVAIIILSLPLSFFLAGQGNNVCYDVITFAMGSRNLQCEIQGLLLVFGTHSVMLCIVARVISVFMIVVFKRNIPRVVLTFFVIAVTLTFTGLCSRHIRFNGGSICGPAHHAMRTLVEFPILSYSFLGLVLQFATATYVSVTMTRIRLSVMRTRIPDTMKAQHKDISLKTKIKVCAACHFKAICLLWRTYVTSLFLSGVIVFAAAQYIISTSHVVGDNYRLGTPEWVACVIESSQVHDYHGDVSECKHFLQGEGTYKRTLVGTILMLGFTIIFLFTELRMFLFQSWYKLLKAGPRSLFSRQRSDAILDTISDDSLTKVWLPERLQNRFLGPWSTRDEEAIGRDLDFQINMFEKRRDQVDGSTQGMPLFEDRRPTTSSSETSSEGKTASSSTKAPGKFKVGPIIAKPTSVARIPTTLGRQKASAKAPATTITFTDHGLQSPTRPQGWIKSLLSSHKPQGGGVSGGIYQLEDPKSKQCRKQSSTLSILSFASSITTAAESEYSVNAAGDCDLPLNNIQELEEEEGELDFLTFLQSSQPPPRR